LFLIASCQFCSAQYFVTYVDALTSWWPPTAIAAGLGVPGYAAENSYNVINLSFWLSSGPVDAAMVWADALTYCSTENPWGNTTAEIQKAWLDAYHSAGKKVLISCFGATEFPTSQGLNPVTTAQQIAQFVITNQFDGVDLDYEDNNAMDAGTGVSWIVQCTQTLASLLPGYIISHAPQAPYFMTSYPQEGYLGVNSQVGNSITWYNVQFYNQGTSDYLTYQTVFVSSDGWATNTSILQIAAAGIPLQKIVLGKPVTQAGVSNTGYVDLSTLTSIVDQGLSSSSWRAGIMGWEYDLDLNGDWINTLAAQF